MDGRKLMDELKARGVRLRCRPDEDWLTAGPRKALTPELAAAIKENKAELMSAMMEDGIIRSEAEVFEMAREFFGEREKEVA